MRWRLRYYLHFSDEQIVALDIQRARTPCPKQSQCHPGKVVLMPSLWASLVTMNRSFVETVPVPGLFSGPLHGALEGLAIGESVQEWKPAVNQPLYLSV